MKEPKIVFRNEDWQVEDNGLLEYRHDGYWLHPDSIADTRKVGGQTYYNVPCHMAGKNWFEPRTFLPAWRKALEIVAPDYDRSMARATAIYTYDQKIESLKFARDWERWERDEGGPEYEEGPLGLKLLKAEDWKRFDAWRKANPYREAQ